MRKLSTAGVLAAPWCTIDTMAVTISSRTRSCDILSTRVAMALVRSGSAVIVPMSGSVTGTACTTGTGAPIGAICSCICVMQGERARRGFTTP